MERSGEPSVTVKSQTRGKYMTANLGLIFRALTILILVAARADGSFERQSGAGLPEAAASFHF